MGKRMLLMSCFSAEHRALTPQQLGRVLDLSPATVELLAVNLVKWRCLERDESGAYMLADPNSSVITVKANER
jgi:DNA-binding IclR family transcriptional regulator